MKAAVLRKGAAGTHFHINGDVAVPRPRNGEVLIRVAAASINPLDTLMREGYGERLFKWLRRPGPVVLGLDGAGTVAAVGRGVRGLSVGDRVMAAVMPFRSGFYAEFAAVPATWVARIPPGWTMEQAAALPYAGLTALQVLRAAGLTVHTARGVRVLVHGGAGGIGSLLVQVLHRWGAWVATTCRTSNVPFVKELGADQVVDYTRQDFTQVLSQMDVVINTVAPKDERLVEAPHFSVLRKGGTFVSLISPTLTLADKLGGPLGLMVSGIWMGVARLRWLFAGKQHRWVYFKPSGRDLSMLANWVEEGAMVPVIGDVFRLDQVGEAQRRAETGPAHGKLLLAIDEAVIKTAPAGKVAA